MKKKPYFVVKVPIFPANIHVCFDEKAFKQLQEDKKIPTKVDYLQDGAMAETHSIPLTDGRTVLALILDLKSIEDFGLVPANDNGAGQIVGWDEYRVIANYNF